MSRTANGFSFPADQVNFRLSTPSGVRTVAIAREIVERAQGRSLFDWQIADLINARRPDLERAYAAAQEKPFKAAQHHVEMACSRLLSRYA